MGEIIGRDPELDVGQRSLAAPGAGPTAVVFVGHAGIGKTTVWAELVRRAQDRGFLVLRSRPAELNRDVNAAVEFKGSRPRRARGRQRRCRTGMGRREFLYSNQASSQ